jgi:hypothetical protein
MLAKLFSKSRCRTNLHQGRPDVRQRETVLSVFLKTALRLKQSGRVLLFLPWIIELYLLYKGVFLGR